MNSGPCSRGGNIESSTFIRRHDKDQLGNKDDRVQFSRSTTANLESISQSMRSASIFNHSNTELQVTTSHLSDPHKVEFVQWCNFYKLRT